MKSRLGDLNDHLFAQLDRLANPDLTAEQIEQEVKRAHSIVALAETVVDNADLQLRAAKLFAEHGKAVLPHLPLIGSSKSEAAE